MDPQSLAFTPRDDFWRIQSDFLRVQQTQADHAERLMRLERRLEDDARMKSVWGSSSPFPGVLSGTPQQGPLHHPPHDAFTGFDDHSTNLIGSLHLDADDEPRRVGATSRANSVRFDESANQGHWSHTSRSSLEMIPRTGSGLGGHPMTERSSSHKSDGRQSSAGHSAHSMTSGRANSLALDTVGQNLSHHVPLPPEQSLVAPGLFVLGSVPSIIRCWLSTNFKHESLLYAVVCTGSYTSLVDARLIDSLAYQDRILRDSEGTRKIKLPVFLPEAIPHPASSRPNSPAPQLPALTVEFTIVDGGFDQEDCKAIQIVLGSDVLRSRNAEIAFSTDRVCLFDDDHNKLSIPLVRPEDDRTFKYLSLSSISRNFRRTKSGSVDRKKSLDISSAKVEIAQKVDLSEPSVAISSEIVSPTTLHQIDRGTDTGSERSAGMPQQSESTLEEIGGINGSEGTVSTLSGEASNGSDSVDVGSSTANLSRKDSSTGVWGNWRRDPEKSNQMDWASTGKTAPLNYQRRDQGIKVLKPTKPASRSFSASQPASASPFTGQSRFFDEGRRRSAAPKDASAGDSRLQRSISGEARTLMNHKENQQLVGKSRPANPVGGASAFAWLNTAASK